MSAQEKKPEIRQLLSDGIFAKNPIFVLALSLCPAVAVTSEAISAVGMGAAVVYVLTMSSILTSIFRNFVPAKIRVPVYITIIAFNVTLVQLIMMAFFPAIFEALGVYLALVVVFAIILARLEVFASKNKVIPSAFDGFGMGLGFFFGLLVIGIIREFLGSGTFFGMTIIPEENFTPILMAILPPGGFIVIGLLIGLFNVIGSWRERKDFADAASASPTKENAADEPAA